MKRALLGIIAAGTAIVTSAATPGVESIINALDTVSCFKSTITYSVTLPQNDADITYTIAASASRPSVADPLAPCDYLIDWTLPVPSGQSTGFSSYFSGHHYRFRDQRLQEYHLDWDSIPFLVGGVQRLAQFAELLPAFIARDLRAGLTDSTYIYKPTAETVFNGRKAVRLRVERVISGMTAMERTYTFDRATLLPLRIDTESNPGSITEQSILADYVNVTTPSCPQLTEEALIEAYPEVFEKYRRSNFRVENLPGTRLPAFSLRRPDGSRLTRTLNDPLKAPTAIVFLDPATGFCRQTVDAVRSAIDLLPGRAEVIWAFTGNDTDLIEEIIDKPMVSEQTVTGAGALARDCGISAMPVVVMVDQEGIIKKIALGFNNDLADVVLQEMALIME